MTDYVMKTESIPEKVKRILAQLDNAIFVDPIDGRIEHIDMKPKEFRMLIAELADMASHSGGELNCLCGHVAYKHF